MRAKIKITGVYVPIITPMYRGTIDRDSLKNLIDTMEPFVEGYVPCLSSGEGAHLSLEQWKEVVSIVRAHTKKFVFAGIKYESLDAVFSCGTMARELGCDGVVVPLYGSTENGRLARIEEIASTVQLPMIVYNTETTAITSREAVLSLEKISEIVAIKDSSCDEAFFSLLLDMKKTGDVSFSVLQGMEHLFEQSLGCDGFLVSLVNVEPKFVHDLFVTPTRELYQKSIELFYQYNLGGDWYITVKALLFARNTIRSAEQVNMALKP